VYRRYAIAGRRDLDVATARLDAWFTSGFTSQTEDEKKVGGAARI
jgi:hypothetical protein